MTKTETREVATARKYAAAGMLDTAARSLSALIRAARTNASKTELLAEAQSLKLTHLPDFIV